MSKLIEVLSNGPPANESLMNFGLTMLALALVTEFVGFVCHLFSEGER